MDPGTRIRFRQSVERSRVREQLFPASLVEDFGVHPAHGPHTYETNCGLLIDRRRRGDIFGDVQGKMMAVHEQPAWARDHGG